ncbi:hypothetical protein GCM10010313_80100 [Streptomyces violarus]|uniref:Phospholipase C n=1 Tax=Streptomyces violarus TaxID=67380 RepID=A0A7W4ZYE4_9ACTN|nr:phospholipase C [Streptomyces violarus]GHD34003.1 hypothetical protein GCM10010313_80100 [Streptomyces violarus]
MASKTEAIAANPKVWRKTAFILNYDENDGLFDHMVPPTPSPAHRSSKGCRSAAASASPPSSSRRWIQSRRRRARR